MDWNFNFNSNPGSLSEFDQESISNVTPIDDSVNFGSSGTRKTGEFSFDLKLGPVCNNSNCNSSPSNNSETTMNKWKETTAGTNSGSSSKRARPGNVKNQKVYCLVDGCNFDLSSCREYHRRHKVCEVHSKTAVVTIRGQKQRFCQQCSRFHSLEEFDEGKRSCRKRLDGHNRRRRKPQPELGHRPPSFLSHFQGGKMLEFSGSNVFPTTNLVSSAWFSATATANATATAAAANAMSYGASSSPAKQGLNFLVPSPKSIEKQFPFMHDESRHSAAAVRLASCIVGRDSDCALSLLSSSSSPSSQLHSNIRLTHHHHNALPFGSSPAIDSVPVTVTSGNDIDVYGSGFFQNATAVSDGSVSGNETASQTFPYHWE